MALTPRRIADNIIMSDGKKFISEKLGEIWQFNLQKLDEIHTELEKSISELEQYYQGFDDLYKKTDNIATLLLSAYSGYNVIDGFEHLKRLKAVINSYKKRYTGEGIDFNLLNNLESKISVLRDKSFDDFPYLFHNQTDDTLEELKEETDKFDPAAFPFRWVSFERNRSKFLVQCESFDIRQIETFEICGFEPPEFITIKTGGRKIKTRDIFSGYPEKFEKPEYLIYPNESNLPFLAAKIKKRIYGRFDFISEKIVPFKSGLTHSKSPGRVRIFGFNHLVLKTG